MDGDEKIGFPKPNSPLGKIFRDINNGITIEITIYTDKIASPTPNNRVDKLFRPKKRLIFNESNNKT
tara:strand:+ start:28 stop:228 length:201 start_codon:yes stop_codon:yes gene_type:complete